MKRSPMKRSQWGVGSRAQPQDREERRNRAMRALLDATPVATRAVIAQATDAVVTVPKDVKAKPGKGAPTAEERRWIEAIVAHGCIACLLDGLSPALVSSRRPAVHHILRGGRRLGHLFTLPLCEGHHQDGSGAPGLLARHPHKARFEERYGCEQTLLHGLQRKLGFPVLEWRR